MRALAIFATLPFLVLLTSLSARAHELWIEPLAWQADPDETLQADLINGQTFEGVRQPYLANRMALFNLYSDSRATRIQNRTGSRPALEVPAHGDGLHVAAYQSTPSTLTYTNGKNSCPSRTTRTWGMSARCTTRAVCRAPWSPKPTRGSQNAFRGR